MAQERPSPMVIRYFLVLFLISLFFLGQIIWPFVSILVLSFLIAGFFQPIYLFFGRRLPCSFASLCTCLIIVVLVFLPLTFFVGALSREALELHQLGKSAELGDRLRDFILTSTWLARARDFLAGYGVSLDPNSLNQALSEVVKTIGMFLYKQASAWAANVANFVFGFFLMVVIIFFLLIDQTRLIEFIVKLSPLPDDQDRRLIDKFEEIARAILIGNGISGVVQGVLGGASFALCGLSAPILWGVAMAILACLPIFGIGVIMGPAALILYLKGRTAAAIFLLAVYFVAFSSMEYFFKPRMVGKQVQMPTLLVFLSVLGGMTVFGFMGIIYGPLVVTAFLTLSEIYLSSYSRFIKGGGAE